jgi:hypothetical protein
MMPINPTSPPQKNSENPQDPSAEKVSSQFRNMMMAGLQSSKMNPMIFVQLGDMAKKAVTQPQIYPQLIKMALDNQIISPEQAGQQVDYRMISLFVMMGKVAKEYMGQNQVKPT